MKQPVIYGEVLFDRFPDGSAVLGGAPFNVAWHLQGFGLHPLFISRVGNDEAGESVLEAMRAWGMHTEGIQRDDDHPTGSVDVRLRDGQPRFDILPAQAYDYIDGAALPACGGSPLIYYGTLVSRSLVSREGLGTLRRKVPAPGFVDVNLRAPWWTQGVVEDALREARWAKLNMDELNELAGKRLNRESAVTAAQDLCRKHDLELTILTLGDQGAGIIGREHDRFAHAPPVEGLVDTVGAGDAFSAVSIVGLIRNWPTQTLLQRALEFAARICQQRGATARDPELYDSILESWRNEP